MFQNFETSSSPEFGAPRLAKLREQMRLGHLDGFIIPRADAHQGEYVAPRDSRLAWLTGFTGSAGWCVALADRAVTAGARRIVLIAAAPSWQQIGALNRGLASSLERGISELAISRLVILRPLREAESTGVGLMQRFVNFYLSILVEPTFT